MNTSDKAPDIYITLGGQLNRSVGAATWKQIVPYMTYYDQVYFDDMDIVDGVPGWYVTNEEEVERIVGVPDAWRIASRRLKAEQEARAKKDREEQEQAEREVRLQQELQAYAAWREAHIAGLESFHDWVEGVPELAWEEVASFSKDVGWYDTGDQWSKAEWNGAIVYRKSYGNTTKYYTTRANVLRLARMRIEELKELYPTAIDRARHILMTHDRGCIGDSSARLVVEEDGLQHYIDLARQQVWYLLARDHRTDEFWKTADKYGLPYVELTHWTSIYGSGYSREVQKAFKERLNTFFSTQYCRYSGVSYLPEEKKWFVDEGHVSAPAVLAPDLSDLFPELM